MKWIMQSPFANLKLKKYWGFFFKLNAIYHIYCMLIGEVQPALKTRREWPVNKEVAIVREATG